MNIASGPTIAIRKGVQNVQHNAQEDSREHRITSLSVKKLLTEGSWTPTQQRLLEVLQRQEYRFASIAQICQTFFKPLMRQNNSIGLHRKIAPQISLKM